MKIYEVNNQADLADELIKTIEKDSKQKIFTLRIIGESDEKLETIIVFEDKTVLMGRIMVQEINGKMAFRVQGNFV
jgi:hypothetical protein